MTEETEQPRKRELEHRIINDHFQNYKRHNIRKAQFMIADIPYNVGKNAYGSNPAWYIDGDNANGASNLAKDCDLLVSEASYASKLDEKAENNKHLTAKQAAFIASNSNAKRLILTHISQRYKTPEEVLEDAKDVFNEVEVAYDLMKIKI